MWLCLSPSKRKAQRDSVLQAMKHDRADRLHKANVRASETQEQTMNRLEQDKLRKLSVRASETAEKTVTRQKHNRTHKASIRASETPEQTVNRQEQDRLRQARKRGLETHEQVLQRKEINQDCMSRKRSRGVSVEEAISAFHSETRAGPDCVCTCCHRMMYRKSVVQCKKAKYTKASPDLLKSSHTPHVNGERMWLSQTTMSVRSNAVLHAISTGAASQACRKLTI